ncbi:hypothetical protein AVEN_246039-1 [Araneus ventricosus]|uniref:Uncharacterized protein n=1 Tax=Araneus ventricosus TaxID=182803 RepID=A0A4Y2JP61_ARAVE|nr:hypothetical protein AVEN_246039-1 [Araneus ventricosus]
MLLLEFSSLSDGSQARWFSPSRIMPPFRRTWDQPHHRSTWDSLHQSFAYSGDKQAQAKAFRPNVDHPSAKESGRSSKFGTAFIRRTFPDSRGPKIYQEQC